MTQPSERTYPSAEESKARLRPDLHPPPRPTPVPGAIPGRDVQPAGETDVLVRIEADHPERARPRTTPRPTSSPQHRTAAPAVRPAYQAYAVTHLPH
ncbi:hypothetical protein ABT013_19250 [Streptomyces bacillaris]|uniref:hypothetical protein n=1 Tax=Streptomyces bacillaris TaxID=68179 RepID=UPI00334D75ED